MLLSIRHINKEAWHEMGAFEAFYNLFTYHLFSDASYLHCSIRLVWIEAQLILIICFQSFSVSVNEGQIRIKAQQYPENPAEGVPVRHKTK